jgi:hypothetical protein
VLHYGNPLLPLLGDPHLQDVPNRQADHYRQGVLHPVDDRRQSPIRSVDAPHLLNVKVLLNLGQR